MQIISVLAKAKADVQFLKFKWKGMDIKSSKNIDADNLKKGNALVKTVSSQIGLKTFHNLSYILFSSHSTEMTAKGNMWRNFCRKYECLSKIHMDSKISRIFKDL